MSLDWGIEKVANYKEVCYLPAEKPDEFRLSPVTETLIWGTMGIGINSITEKNYVEFYKRLSFFHRMAGKPIHEKLKGEWVDRYITMDEVKAHIGLWTNATPRPLSKFLSSMYESLTYNVRAPKPKVEAKEESDVSTKRP